MLNRTKRGRFAPRIASAFGDSSILSSGRYAMLAYSCYCARGACADMTTVCFTKYGKRESGAETLIVVGPS